MIRRNNELFVLETKITTYCFRVMPSGHLEHLYYGKKISLDENYGPLADKIQYLGGTELAYSKEYPKVGLENLCLEMSSLGKGDLREPFLEITYEDGSSTCDFLFQNAKLYKTKKTLRTLPSSYLEQDILKNNKNHGIDACSEVEQYQEVDDTIMSSESVTNNYLQNDSDYVSLEIELYDRNYQISLVLIYSVFYDCDVITRSCRLINSSSQNLKLDRLMSSQLDFDTDDYIVSTFHGAWAREMKRYEMEAKPGIYVNASNSGTSGNRSNPFFMISEKNTNEDYGNCYGFNLIYSGNHYASFEVNSMGRLRVVNGINPNGFQFLIKPGEEFESPEAVMTYSNLGFTGMSHHLHQFIREHIVRGEWKNRLRPILMNSWEANYFKYNEGKLLKQAKAARDVGIELFVLDDGWFGRRDDDTKSLGDWTENKEKLGSGLKGFADKLNDLGMKFGIWVEPEMVNEDSDCYQKHPDWAVKVPGKDSAIGRNQLILDLTREEVRSYLIDEMTRVFSGASIRYVKWDMNRIFGDFYSPFLEAERQKEFGHRYIIGLYQVLDTLTRCFPEILFESCASGGNRFDLGMLCYMPQIWASDNTDAICRAAIQTGYSYGYPMSVIGAHVSSSPNHQTLRNTSIDTRFEVAAFGLLGYECNISELSSEERKKVSEQISFYKKYRNTLQYGDFFRIKTNENEIYQYMSVDRDKKEALGLFLQKEVTPNYSYAKFKTKGLDVHKKYRFTNRPQIHNIKEFGDLVNTLSPIHIKKDSLAHNMIAMVKKIPGEIEECTAFGDLFNNAGVKLKQGFQGTGYNEEVRLFQDFTTRMYVWEEVE